MTVKEKQGFGLYFLLAFGMAWLCQVGGCMALLQQNNSVLYQLALIVTMFCPLLAVLLVQNGLSAPTYRHWLEGAGQAAVLVGSMVWPGGAHSAGCGAVFCGVPLPAGLFPAAGW